MNKSLRVKLSVTLMATVLVTMITSVLVNNFFLSIIIYPENKSRWLAPTVRLISCTIPLVLPMIRETMNQEKPRRMRRQIFMNGLVRAALPV